MTDTPGAEVVDLPVVTSLDIDPDRVIAKAAKAGLKGVVIMGYDQEGDWYFASSYADGGDVLWHLARAQHKLMKIADERGDDD